MKDYFNSYLKNNEEKYCDFKHVITVLEYILNEPFNKIKTIVNNAEVTVTEEQIKAYLDETFEKEAPEVKKRIEKRKTNTTIGSLDNFDDVNLSSLEKSAHDFDDDFTASRYYFEPYTLEYFKKYTSILREKMIVY